MVGLLQFTGWRAALAALAGITLGGGAGAARASDHLDTPTVIADPRADIGDVYAWISPDGRQLNLVMTIVGHSFSDKLQYVFHVDSGTRFGATTATTSVVCRFPADKELECQAGGDADAARGDASNPAGLQGHNHRFRVFAGLRDDPFFNNVRGTRAAYEKAALALRNGTARDAAGCPNFDAATSRAILDEWRHTDGGPGRNFLAGWTPASIVVSIDLEVVAKGGRMLAVWGATASSERQIDRAGRPLTGNALLGTLADESVSNRLKEEYNAASPATSAEFVAEIQNSLGLYDSFDGHCGNQLLADRKAQPSMRYHALATLLADDRLWVNSASSVCTQLFAVELANLAGRRELMNDCGGRTPNYDAVNVYRSLLVDASNNSVDDGVHHDERVHSTTVFPFLAARMRKDPPAASRTGARIVTNYRRCVIPAATGLFGSLGLIWASTAAAHTGTGLAGGFAPGFAHPFTGFDHLLAMVCVGLWGAFLGAPLIHILPIVFPMMMVGGAALGMLGVPLPPVEIGIALSVLVLGGCIALAIEAPVWAASLIVAAFAVFHGYAHGKELPSAADPIGYSAGFTLATGLLHVLGIGVGLLRERPGGTVAIRGLGAIIGVAGILFLCRALSS